MHKPFNSTAVDGFFYNLIAAVRLFAPDSPIPAEKRERLKRLLIANQGTPSLSTLAEVTGQDRLYAPIFGLLSAIFGLWADDIPSGNFGGLARAMAARIGLGSLASNLYVKSFHEVAAASDPACAAQAVQPLARRALEEGLRIPWKNVWRDLLQWDDETRGAWLASFQGEA